MAATILLDRTSWDLVLDVNGDIALATDPYSLAQDAASAIATFLGECYWDTTIGVPWIQQVLGHRPPLGLVAQLCTNAAQTVPGVASAKVTLTKGTNRVVAGTVTVTSDSGETSAATPFSVVNPQGG